MRWLVMRFYNLHKYMKMALVVIPEWDPQKQVWKGFVERMEEILTES